MCKKFFGTYPQESVWGDGSRDVQREKFICDEWAGPSELNQWRQEAENSTPPPPRDTGGWHSVGEAASLSRGQFLERDPEL